MGYREGRQMKYFLKNFSKKSSCEIKFQSKEKNEHFVSRRILQM